MADTDPDDNSYSQNFLASVIEKLVETFNASNDQAKEDLTKRQIQSSAFNNTLKATALQQSGNKILQSLNGGEAGLYALILRSEEIEAKEEDTPPSSWWSILTDLPEAIVTTVQTANGWVYNLLSPSDAVKVDALKALDLLDFKGYYIFILSNVGDDNPIPTVLPPSDTEPNHTYQNLPSYPIAQTVSKRLRTAEETFKPGTLVKIQYENAINRDSPIITEIIEDDPQFTTIILASMAARSALNQFDTCDTDSSLSGVTHPSGDAIGEKVPEELIYINGDAIYPYTKDMKNAELVIFYHGYEESKSNQQRQNTILSVLQKNKDKISNKLFLIPNGLSKKYSEVEKTISKLKGEKGVSITGYKLGFWSAGAQGGKTALEQKVFTKVEIADPSPPSIPTSILTPGSNITMIYNKLNWGSPPKPYYTDNIENYISTIEETGATVSVVNDSHTTIMEKAIGRLIT